MMSPRWISSGLSASLLTSTRSLDQQGVLHRPRRDVERLHQERLDEQREDSAVITMPGSSRRNDLRLGLARRVRTRATARAGRGARLGLRSAAATARRRRSAERRPSSVVMASSFRPVGGDAGQRAASRAPASSWSASEGSAGTGRPGPAARRRDDRPITLSLRHHAAAGSPRWARESSESARWSPISQSRPAGTVDGERLGVGLAADTRYALSREGVPLTRHRVPRLRCRRQITWSPPAGRSTRFT